MQAAGVNPALAMNGGVTTQAASSAQASSATAMPANLDLSGVIGAALQAKDIAIKARLAKSQEKLLNAQANKFNADAKKTETETA